jgi:hypothetical protein
MLTTGMIANQNNIVYNPGCTPLIAGAPNIGGVDWFLKKFFDLKIVSQEVCEELL